MMKKILTVYLIICAFAGNAQPLNNAWINYNRTYYKFSVVKDVITRIPQSALVAAGLGSVNADHFQLWRNGEQVRLFTSVNNAPLGASDFIEFWGQMNDGMPDKELFRIADFQLNDKYSLETDTASYFLTVNSTGGNLRYNNAINTAPSAATPDAYFMRTIEEQFKNILNRGFANRVGEFVYSSSYDQGEGWTGPNIVPSSVFQHRFLGLNVFTGGPANSLTIKVSAAGNAENSRNIKLNINGPTGTEVYNQPMPFFTYRKATIPNLPLNLLTNTSNVVIAATNVSSISTDRMVVASLSITYPAQFNFNNEKSFFFDLEASATGNYLNISNFNTGGVAPILYDLTNGLRYFGEIVSTAGLVKFVLPPSTLPNRRFVLMNAQAAEINNINSLTPRNFINYSIAANQADYLIISNKDLYNDGNGINNVERYRTYRASANGGSYNSKIFEIGELTDQFAYGIKSHPAAIRDFVRFAHRNFVVKPKYVMLIGRGVDYLEAMLNRTNSILPILNKVPTFGWPASDILLVSEPGITMPLVPIGRLSAINGREIAGYLQKVIEYETAQRTPSPFIADKAWMKKFMHVIGGKDVSENETFKTYMDGYKRIAEDTLLGASVETFSKTSTGSVQQANSQRIEQLFAEGLGYIGYFGHSSANTFEFNLSNPELYNNGGKYPFFNVSGCSAGNFFNFDPSRASGVLSLSEKYILAPQRGSIGFLANTHFGIPPFLNFYNTNFYNNFSKNLYGNSVGNQVKEVLASLGASNPNLDYYTRIHLEEIALHGDPAIKIYHSEKPDYAIEDPMVLVSPNIISVADASFSLKVKMQNIGKANGDSIFVMVKRKLPNDSIKVLFNGKIAGIRSVDSLQFSVPINPLVDKGLNQLIIELDKTNIVDELFETNNTVVKDFYIFEDELRPTFPYNFSIINAPNITYVANTANPLGENRQYQFEIDTTELFNSSIKRTMATNGIGGIVQFSPSNMSYRDSTVYYWRVAMTPTNNNPIIWNTSSFIYLPNSTPGFNQSHYYQHKKSIYNNITLLPDSKLEYPTLARNITIRTGLHPFVNFTRINVNLDFDQLELYGCRFNSLQFYVFDTVTLKPWKNTNINPTEAQFRSWPVCQNSATPDDPGRYFFEFPYDNAGGIPYRKRAMDFIDAIPSGMYVAITNLGNKLTNTSFVNQWMADTSLYGSGNSLYHKLKSIGFSSIDSFSTSLPFLYFYKKGSAAFSPIQQIGSSDTVQIEQIITLNSLIPEGTIESPTFGPATSWNELHWRGTSNDPSNTDTTSIQVWGIKNNGASTLMATVAPSRDTSLAFINPTIYPYLKLKMFNKDDRNLTPQQLRYWRINARLAPEGAVAPNILYSMSADTVDQGDKIDFKLAFKNISQTAFDSMLKVKLIITDRFNVPHVLNVPQRKALLAGDTLTVNYLIDTKDYPGANTLFIEFNPDNHQPEQLHYNNILYKEFYVREDKYNPLLDVTFDGVHILNKDIVASKPNVLIKLKDESRFLVLKDTALMKVQVRFPNQTIREYHFGDSMVFIPANLGANGENTATIEMTPFFPEDGEYELIVSGKDVNGNKAGALDYKVSFNVINKPMISNLLNYPNPFTTSTAFVFTVTGSEVPQNMRIQILTITGKVVREITKDELGPIHIGRNITEFKWDGTDMYGQKLANGVYIYRVLTNLNGKSLDKYRAEGDNTDKFFNKGYGKMYLMR
jgi:hypothetical protein